MFCTKLLKRTFATKPWSYKEAIEWQKSFNQGQIPKEHVSVSFSRSSGPGGQNVNKVSTKVDLRLSLQKATWIPEYAIEKIKSSPHLRKNKQNELIVTSDKTRSQAKNIQDCYEKLTNIIRDSVSVVKEADEATLQRVALLREKENNKRKEIKKKQSQKKSQRRSKGDDF